MTVEYQNGRYSLVGQAADEYPAPPALEEGAPGLTIDSPLLLAGIGRFIAPVFAPLGFGNWISSTALLTGLSAKEAVVSTLAVLTNVPDTAQLSTVLGSLFTPLSAVSFLTFTLLYMPCFAAVAAVKRELGSARYAALAMFAQCCVAWIVAFLVYQIGGWILGV